MLEWKTLSCINVRQQKQTIPIKAAAKGNKIYLRNKQMVLGKRFLLAYADSRMKRLRRNK